jgi:hypothetical protein
MEPGKENCAVYNIVRVLQPTTTGNTPAAEQNWVYELIVTKACCTLWGVVELL